MPLNGVSLKGESINLHRYNERKPKETMLDIAIKSKDTKLIPKSYEVLYNTIGAHEAMHNTSGNEQADGNTAEWFAYEIEKQSKAELPSNMREFSSNLSFLPD
jgi:hypothetical protein